MIFAVLDPSPLTVCINCSFYIYHWFNLPHLYLEPLLGWPRWNFAWIFGIRKVESLDYWTIRFGTMPACDRQTYRHTTTANTTLA